MSAGRAGNGRQAGISLIELVIFIVVVSIGVVGILSVMNVTTKASADPLVRKQALAIAESLLEEIELQAFTFCDPNDARALTATSATVGPNGCAATVMSIPSAPRLGSGLARDPQYQNVADYNNFVMGNPIRDVNGNTITELAGYSAAVAISQVAFGGTPNSETLKIDVTVTGPANMAITLTGYRMRYAPNALP
ncbi:MAG TPA: type II secretion system protein [Burkholderiaceae bacterium]|nr:type II secretion system protein [Burkholderiaceae bacterium]